MHELKNDIDQAKLLLHDLIPKTEENFVTETDFGIGNSLGYVYLDLDNKNAAYELFKKVTKKYENLPVIADKLLYVRVIYNYIYSQYYMEDYDGVIEYGLKLLNFLEVNHLKIMFAKLHHLVGIAYEMKEHLKEAKIYVKRAADFFLIDNQLFNYLKTLRALAEIQFKLGNFDEGTRALQIVRERIVELSDPKNSPEMIKKMEEKYL